MKTASIRLGVVGFGRLSERVHLPTLRKLSGVRVVAVADADPERCRAAAALAPRARIHSEYQTLLADAGVEAVLVTLPTGLHAEAALAVRAADKHMYLEKPLTAVLEDGRRVCDAWRGAAVTAQIGFNYRWHPLVLELKGMIEAGLLGPVKSVHTCFHSRTGPMPSWKKTRAQGGGVLLDLASHHFDLLPFLFEAPLATVDCRLQSLQHEDDAAEVHGRLANGVEVHSSFSLAGENEDWIKVVGARRSVVLDRQRGWCLRFADQPLLPSWPARVWLAATRSHARTRWLAPNMELSFPASLIAFFSAIREGRPASPSLDDGYRSLCVVHAAETSAAMERSETVTYE